MDEEPDINTLLTRYFNGEVSLTEKKAVMEWVKKSRYNQYHFDQLVEYWEKRTVDPKLISHEFQKDKIWSQYMTTVAKSTNSKSRTSARVFRWSIAASLLLLISVSLILMNRDLVSDTQELVMPVATIEKYNPIGQKSQTQLPDGSKVWLNADSKLVYPENFDNSTRTVYLEGEAFFDVFHDSVRPFIVVTEKVRVQVLGTKFNVDAFVTSQETNIALLEGSVKVTSDRQSDGLLIVPESGVSYSDQLGIFREFSKAGNPEMFEKAMSWKNGKLIFDGVGLGNFVTEISRWYGVKVSIEGVPRNDWRLVGSFDNEYLTNVLDAISYNKDFTYELEGKELTLIFN
ncbi:FecR family protein [Algoriphagus sp. NG3]|uniref:FecR family protein n=1 Tax=Algoriphagus sp. NG3 TaxID=3097546 RepID=UPI002A8366BB|nr:FecR domain-containing protein [Algoriphagus sp. NG3]WPR77677.1 FecR domain-containing protein [Algoriphagus sp. NG3]